MTFDNPSHESAQLDWIAANQRFLSGFVDFARQRIQQAYQDKAEPGESVSQIDIDGETKLWELKQAIPGIAPIDYLGQLYQLSEFEQQILLLAVAPELDSQLLYPNGNDKPIVINFSLALAILPHPEWHSILANGNLRRNGLLELGEHKELTQSRLHVPETIVHFIVGFADEDQELKAFSEEVVSTQQVIDEKNEALCQQMAQIWDDAEVSEPCLLTLVGGHGELKQEIAAFLAKFLQRRLLVLPVHFLPSDMQKLKDFASKWRREIKLHNYLLFLDCETDSFVDPAQQIAADHFMNLLDCSLLCSSQDRRKKSLKQQYTFEVSHPTPSDQQIYWEYCLKEQVSEDDIKQLVAHFSMSFVQIEKIVSAWQALEPRPSIWSLCKGFSRQQTFNLAQRIEPSRHAEQIVLPKLQSELLEDLVSHIRYQNVVYEEWGFQQNASRGKGLTALFYGASGTGKTTAAEYLAYKLDLDLYRIDLSNIVSKYVGETEKNLNQIFDAAEKSGAILLFDEADALFSKRTQVSGSNDKFANAQVSYLLQRLEAYKGLAILTSNLKDAFDQAFIRRIRFVIQFPFPEKAERAKIWQNLLPDGAPVEDVDVQKLALLSVSGGEIKNISLNACIDAAAKKQPLSMRHYLKATKNEFLKQDKSLPVQEVRGWV